MKLRRHFSTDQALEEGGVWVEIGGGARLRVARFGNPAHQAALDRFYEPFRALMLSGGEIPVDDQRRITAGAAAEGLLLDWEGVENDDGEPLAYSREAAATLLEDLKDFRELVLGIATTRERFRAGQREAIKGN